MKKQYIQFQCRHQKIERTDDFFVVGGSRNYLYAKFDFCEDWAGEQQYAVFTGDLQTFRIPIVDGECEVPWEMLLTKRFFVGCEAGQRITSNAAEVKVNPCGAPEETGTPRKPTPTLQSQIGNLADLKTDAKGNLVAAVNEVFDGEKSQITIEGNGDAIVFGVGKNPVAGTGGGGAAVDPEAIRQAVDNYMAENPVNVEETDPTVPEWAKQPKKPTYTAAEVGALPADTNIPSDEHINALINTALSKIPNAAEVAY